MDHLLRGHVEAFVGVEALRTPQVGECESRKGKAFPVSIFHQHCDYDNDNDDIGDRVDNQGAAALERCAIVRSRAHWNPRSRLADADTFSHFR